MGTKQELELLDMVKAATKAAQAAADNDDEAEKSRAIDCLKRLERAEVTLKLLAATQAGKAVKKLSKAAAVPEVAAAAAKIVAKWKEMVASAGGGGGGLLSPSSSGGGGLKRTFSDAKAAAANSDGLKRTSSSGAEALSGPAPKPRSTGDPTRDKGRQLFAESLQRAVEEGADPSLACGIARIAADMEEALFQHTGRQLDKNYKAKFRSLNFNMKDSKNPDLRSRMLTESISPTDLMTLSPEELASDEKRKENEKIREAALWEAERGKADKEATTDQFECGKCRQRKTRYFQMQTRSADEPMTTFVTCVNCNHRWKFC